MFPFNVCSAARSRACARAHATRVTAVTGVLVWAGMAMMGGSDKGGVAGVPRLVEWRAWGCAGGIVRILGWILLRRTRRGSY
jgi:hypothetical protein